MIELNFTGRSKPCLRNVSRFSIVSAYPWRSMLIENAWRRRASAHGEPFSQPKVT